MALIYRSLDQNTFGADQNLYLLANDGDIAVRFVIRHSIFVEEFNARPSDQPANRFPELLATVQAACDWAYERAKYTLEIDNNTASVDVMKNDFLKARKWLRSELGKR